MKHSPLCSRDQGREIYFTARHDDTKYRVLLSPNLLDDSCGTTATEAERKAWVKDNMPTLLDLCVQRTGGGDVPAPFNRVIVEEIN